MCVAFWKLNKTTKGGGLLPYLNIREELLWREKTLRVETVRVGEYYDEKNQRYMFRKMVDGERVTITTASLADLRKQENDLLCKIDKGARFNTKKAKETLNQYFDYWFETFAKSGRKATTCINYKSYYNT